MSDSFYFYALSEHIAKSPLEGKFVSSNPPPHEGTCGPKPESLRRFAGQYWFIELPGGKHKALSTEEVADTLGMGSTARSISGPFSTREEAAKSLERYWEMMMDNEDD